VITATGNGAIDLGTGGVTNGGALTVSGVTTLNGNTALQACNFLSTVTATGNGAMNLGDGRITIGTGGLVQAQGSIAR
jgi:hypothetical protein